MTIRLNVRKIVIVYFASGGFTGYQEFLVTDLPPHHQGEEGLMRLIAGEVAADEQTDDGLVEKMAYVFFDGQQVLRLVYQELGDDPFASAFNRVSEEIVDLVRYFSLV